MQSTSKVTARQIRSFEGPYLKWSSGTEAAEAISVSSPENLVPDSLVFIASRELLESALKTASLLIVEQKVSIENIQLASHQALWTTPALKAALVLVLPLFDPRKKIQDTPISAGAHIHPTAQVGAGTRIDAGAVIGAYAKIGANCYIHSNAVVEAFCQIGDRCILQAGCVIGSDGFGYATDKIHHKVPHIGITVLEDDVEIGAGTMIDRGTIGETRIGSGTKFDNLCHVAHNCQIGKRGLFAAGFMVAGSSKIGDDFSCGGDVIVTDHVQVANKVSIGGRGVITKDVQAPGAYTGYPLEPVREGLKTIQNLRHLSKMRQDIKTILKKLGIEQEQG